MLAGEVISELWPPPPPSLLPDGLEEMPPGPELARVLAGIDLDSLPGFDLVVVMAAHARQVSHQQAELLGLVARVADASSEASDLVSDDDDEFAADEIRAALCLTRRAAVSLLQLARDLERLPELVAALRSGSIDLPRARVVCSEVATLDDEEAQAVVSVVWSGLLRRPPASWERGHAAWCSPSTPQQPRSATSGEWREEGWNCRPTPTAPPTSSPGPCPPSGPTPPSAAWTPWPGWPRERTTPAASTRCVATSSWTSWTAGTVADGRGVIDLRVDLATLTRLSENPGEIPGYGPVVADIARRVAATQVGSVWRVAVTHPDSGAVLWDGTTRRRPTRRATQVCRGAVTPPVSSPGAACPPPARTSTMWSTTPRGDPPWWSTSTRRAATTTGSRRPGGGCEPDPTGPSSGPVHWDTNTPRDRTHPDGPAMRGYTRQILFVGRSAHLVSTRLPPRSFCHTLQR